MSRAAGRTQEILEGTTATLKVPFLVDGEPQTPTSATVQIHAPGGSVILPTTSTGVTVASGLVSLSQSWDADAYPYDTYYRAEWTITYSSTEYKQRQYFDVVRRRFESGLIDSDLTDTQPHLAIQLPDGTTSFAKWRNRAWDRIRNMVRAQIKGNPGNIAKPELLFEAHRALTLSLFFRDISRREGDIHWAKHESHQDDFDAEVKTALSLMAIDSDEDKTIVSQEKRNQRFRNWGR